MKSIAKLLTNAVKHNDNALLKNLIVEHAPINKSHMKNALIKTAIKGNLKAMKMLLAAGADINAHNKFGSTPLMRATAYGHMAIVDYLLTRGVNKELENNKGYTALILGAMENQQSVVEALLDAGSNKKHVDWSGKTALDYASLYMHTDVAATIENHGTLSWRLKRINYNNNMIPNEYKCPISLDIMEEPIGMSSGQTYNKKEIQAHIKYRITNGLPILCPITNQTLLDDSNNLKTNIVIKSIIEQWVSLQEEKAQRITHLRNGFFGISASAKRQREAEDNNQNPSQKLKIDF